MRSRRDITLAQAEALSRQASFASAIAPMADDSAPGEIRKPSLGPCDRARHDGAISWRRAALNVSEGRFLSAAEAAGGRPVCVIGATWRPIFSRNESLAGQPHHDRPAQL